MDEYDEGQARRCFWIGFSGILAVFAVVCALPVFVSSCKPPDDPPSASDHPPPAQKIVDDETHASLQRAEAQLDALVERREARAADGRPERDVANGDPDALVLTKRAGPASPTSAEATEEVARTESQPASGYGSVVLNDRRVDLVPLTLCPNQEQHAHLADALASALDPATGVVAQAAARIEVVAPDVWRIMIRQQYAKAVAALVLPWGIVLVALLYAIIVSAWWPHTPHAGDDRFFFVRFVPFVVGLGGCIWGCFALSKVAKFIVNPAYYAIQDLLLLLLRNANG
ncbi:hypothetical protein HY480_02140 [Candidatus Uhrbacteria bacterium]|nr:hypothetical protein [Candidatus Uhrbacteria bacterium]